MKGLIFPHVDEPLSKVEFDWPPDHGSSSADGTENLWPLRSATTNQMAQWIFMSAQRVEYQVSPSLHRQQTEAHSLSLVTP